MSEPAYSPLQRREAGILLHPSSLPGPGETGDFGEGAYRFVDFLAQAGLSVWQILPLGPTHEDRSPYQSLSVHAGNPDFISLEKLAEERWLDPTLLPAKADGRVALLAQAFEGFRRHCGPADQEAFETFIRDDSHWLEDYALFRVLRQMHGKRAWTDWPAPLRDRQPEALEVVRREQAAALDRIRFEQFIFYRQWQAIKGYANQSGIRIFGDMPIFVAHDSADVWAQRQCFQLDELGRPVVVAGVPPDYFSETGQRWGNPHYDWEWMESENFSWWEMRVESQLKLFDLVRIDHFRGFQAYWEVPAHEETAINGRWVEAPGEQFLNHLHERLNPLPVVAEDLGIITKEVEALRLKFALPGMKILQFAFDSGPTNPYLPHNHELNFVVYTGTHDNDTTLGWYEGLDEQQRETIHQYLGYPGEPMPWPLVRSAYASVARLAVVPLQDVLALSSEHRMNTPGTCEGNWGWRFEWEMLPKGLTERLRTLAETYRRCCLPEHG